MRGRGRAGRLPVQLRGGPQAQLRPVARNVRRRPRRGRRVRGDPQAAAGRRLGLARGVLRGPRGRLGGQLPGDAGLVHARAAAGAAVREAAHGRPAPVGDGHPASASGGDGPGRARPVLQPRAGRGSRDTCRRASLCAGLLRRAPRGGRGRRGEERTDSADLGWRVHDIAPSGRSRQRRALLEGLPGVHPALRDGPLAFGLPRR
mmetsp:Transcript_67593/g.177273  ORF Transcript_67593/g.177273 Transcript_67593/m.177273 type:complete len:204 (+) Transcript_67593:1156-1767(+)